MTTRNDIEQLFRAHYVRMHRLAVVLLHDDDLARDIVHDVFVSLLDAPPGCIIAEGYLLTAVRNRCLNHIRDCGIHQRVANRYLLDNEEYEAGQWPDEETIARIHTLVETDVSSQARKVMELRFADGLKFAQIARSMGISETAVYRHLRHALIIIRQKLNQDEP